MLPPAIHHFDGAGFCNQLFFIRVGDWPCAQPPLWMVRFFFWGFLPLGLNSEFSILLDKLPTRAPSLVNPELIGLRAPATHPRTTRISEEQPCNINTSGGDVTNRDCGEMMAFWGHFIETRSLSLIPPPAILFLLGAIYIAYI